MKILRPEVIAQHKSSGGIFEAMDNGFTELFNVTTQELDFIAENATEEETDILVNLATYEGRKSFTDRRKALEVRNKYLELYNKQNALPNSE